MMIVSVDTHIDQYTYIHQHLASYIHTIRMWMKEGPFLY